MPFRPVHAFEDRPYKETKSAKWTTVSALLPVVLGLILCFLVTQVWRLATT